MTPHLDELEAAAAFVHRSAASSHRDGGSLRQQFQALFGLWVAEKAGVPRAASWVDEATRRVRDAVARECELGSFDPYDHDAKLLLLCHAAMRERGEESPPLTRFRAELVSSLRSMEAVPQRLAGELQLLEAMGEAPIAPLAAEFPRGDVALLRADTAAIRTLCNRVAAASLFGSRRAADDCVASFVPAMPVLLLEKLREYDLVLGASILRSLRYLDVPAADEIRYATDYLLCQQQGDGRFGFYAREVAERPALVSADADLYLPVTVAVLWSLIEASVPGFSLIAEQGSGAADREAVLEA